MVFSDTTAKAGLIQDCEDWTGLGDGGISGDATALKKFTARINRAFDRVLPRVFSYSDFLRFDDPNHTDAPWVTFNLVSGQGDYKLTADDNGLSILNVTNVLILTSSSATDYSELTRMRVDEADAVKAITQNASNTGIPSKFLESGPFIYFDVLPNYSATNGVKVLFERDPSYFVSTDTTKEPGIPKPFHRLLSMYAAHDWLTVNAPANSVLLTRLEANIAQTEEYLDAMIALRNPEKCGLRPAVASNR